MTPRRLLFPLVLAALHAAPAPAAPFASAKLLACDPVARTAEFRGKMVAVADAVQLQMRFTLQVREDHWERVAAPTFDEWKSAVPGKLGYEYRKQVQGLLPGDYRVVVRFRWRDAAGTVVRTATRRSKVCSVPDERADLVPVRIKAARGPGDWKYTVVVANRGRSDAGPFGVGLTVDGVPEPDQPVDGLAAGGKVSVVFSGPPCEAVLVAAVDPDGLVEEAEEADDTLSEDCG